MISRNRRIAHGYQLVSTRVTKRQAMRRKRKRKPQAAKFGDGRRMLLPHKWIFENDVKT